MGFQTDELDVDARDVALITRLRNGDGTAHDELIRLYGARLIRFAAQTVGSIDRSQDVVQEMFLRMWQNRQTLTVTRDVRAYLFWLTRNRAIHALHADRSAANRDAAWAAVRAADRPASANTGEHALEIAERRTQIWNALSGVPPRCREVFMLVWDEQLTYADVARVLGISVPTVRNQMSRALKRVVEVLGSASQDG
jgi:RNA polymerase sigma-70 factor (ECF subfamily)